MKKKFVFLCSAFAILAVTAFATFANRSGATEIVYDFSVFNAETDQPTSEDWSYTSGDWGNIRNAVALATPSAINARLADVLFTCNGGGNIVWQLYGAIEGNGNQIVMNNSGVKMQLLKASAGDEIVFFATANREAEFAGQTIAKNAEYANYTIKAEADAPTIDMPRGLTIRTITIKKAAAANGKTWDFTKFSAESIEGMDGTGNLSGNYDPDPTMWSAVKNSKAVEGKLMLSETKEFPLTEGISFKANSGKLFVRNYPEANGGCHLFSNDNAIEMYIPTKKDDVVVIKAVSLKNTPTLAVISGAQEEGAVINNSYNYYTYTATGDMLQLKYARNIAIKQIYVGEAPTQADPALTVAAPELEIIMGETANIEYQTKSDIAPTFESSNTDVATVDATGKVTAVKAGTAIITVAHTANAYFKEAKQEVKVTVKMAGSNNITELLAAALQSAENGAATLTLDGAGEYALDTIAACDTINVTIEGNGAKIVVDSAGAISAKQGLTIKNVKFDATKAKAAGLILLPKMTTAADSTLYNLHGANGKNSFFNEKAITLENVSVSELATSLIANEDRWCVKNLNIKNSIFQLNATSGKFINFQAGGGDGMIKNINVEGSTFYNLQANDGIFFLAYNTSKPMPEKFYGKEDNTCTWTMTNNTFAQVFKQMSDRYTENKVATVKWTNNVWSSHTNLTKTRNCTFEMTAADNSGDGANLGNFGTKENLQITVPETAYDFNEDALIPYFSLFKRTMAYEFRMGDTRWLVAGKVAADRTWDFAKNAENYADEWALIKADATNWGQVKAGQEVRYQNIVKIDTAEAVVLNAEQAQKIKFLEGLTWIAAEKKLIIGDGSNATYACLQLQKGIKFIFDNVYAGDTILFTACNTGKNATEDCVKFATGYPYAIGLSKAGEYTTDTIIALKTGKFEVEMAADTRLQKLEVRSYEGDYTYPGLAVAMKSGKTNLRLNVGDTDSIAATTKNDMVPVYFNSSDVSVATVDSNGEIKAVAPGTAIITIDQEAAGIYYGMVKNIFVQVMPELAFHKMVFNYDSEMCETVYSPDAIAAVAKADNNDVASYYVTPEYATWMYFNNGNNGDNVVIAKEPNNAWMKIDFREGANDSVCHQACPVSEKTGTAACYNPSSGGGYAYSMDYYVTGINAVKFYYHTSASKVGGLRIQVFENTTEGEPIATEAGVSDQKGKGVNGLSFTVSLNGLDKNKNYIVRALREGDGDVLVYAAKFILEPEDAIVTLADAGYATFFDSLTAYEIPEGVKAFVVTEATTDALVYSELTGIIPHGTAVMLESVDKVGGEIVLKGSYDRTKYDGANLLYGSDEATTTFADSESLFYKLAYGKTGTLKSKTFCWWWGAENGAAFEIEGHRAWLAIPQNIATAPAYLIGNDATGISSTVAASQDNAEFYNMQGQRVNAPRKGIFIHNNKKVVVK